MHSTLTVVFKHLVALSTLFYALLRIQSPFTKMKRIEATHMKIHQGHFSTSPSSLCLSRLRSRAPRVKHVYMQGSRLWGGMDRRAPARVCLGLDSCCMSASAPHSAPSSGWPSKQGRAFLLLIPSHCQDLPAGMAAHPPVTPAGRMPLLGRSEAALGGKPHRFSWSQVDLRRARAFGNMCPEAKNGTVSKRSTCPFQMIKSPSLRMIFIEQLTARSSKLRPHLST